MNEEQAMHWNSDKKEFMTYDNANEIIKETFESLLSSYQIGLEISVNDSNFITDGVNLLYYKFHEIYFKVAVYIFILPNG